MFLTLSLLSQGAQYSDAPEVAPHSGLERQQPQAAKPDLIVAPSEARGHKSHSTRLGDMKASTFWLLVGLIAIIVIAVSVGGAVGGTVAARNNGGASTRLAL